MKTKTDARADHSDLTEAEIPALTARKTQAGKVMQISSMTNPRIREIRALFAARKYRDQSGLFIAEGLKLSASGLDKGWPCAALLIGPDRQSDADIQSLAARARARGADIINVPNKILTSLSKRSNPQAVIGIFRQRFSSSESLAGLKDKPILAFDRIRDPGNLGTILRTTHSAGIGGIILVGPCTDPFALESVRASMGSLFVTPIGRMETEAFVTWALDSKRQIIGTRLSATKDYRKIAYDDNALIIMGNEREGLEPRLTKICHHQVRIPQSDNAESLNLAIATGLMIYEARRHQLSL